MEKKIIEVSLENSDEMVCNLKFKFADKVIDVNLYDDNMEQLQVLFVKVMKELIDFDITFEFNKELYKDYKNKLALDVCDDYIKQLNIDIEELLNSNNLKAVRNDSNIKDN